MGRYQRGHVFERHGAFHIRYYDSEIIDGQPRRVQRSERLCSKDNRHYSIGCKPVQQLAAKFMEKVNAASGAVAEPDIKITGSGTPRTFRISSGQQRQQQPMGIGKSGNSISRASLRHSA